MLPQASSGHTSSSANLAQNYAPLAQMNTATASMQSNPLASLLMQSGGTGMIPQTPAVDSGATDPNALLAKLLGAMNQGGGVSQDFMSQIADVCSLSPVLLFLCYFLLVL